MPRRPREAAGGLAYHVLNRGVGRMTIFEKTEDYAAFERILAEAVRKLPGVRLLSYCLMPNHWHLVLWPRGDGELSEFMRWLTVTHTQRWHAHHKTSGTGPLYQGRFKSFPVQRDAHLLTLCRYVERNALRCGLVERAEQWRWSSLWHWHGRSGGGNDGHASTPGLTDWPIPAAPGVPGVPGGRPSRWLSMVNRPETAAELEAVRMSLRRGRPFGSDRWIKQTAARLGLESTLRPRGRPRKKKPGG